GPGGGPPPELPLPGEGKNPFSGIQLSEPILLLDPEGNPMVDPAGNPMYGQMVLDQEGNPLTGPNGRPIVVLVDL
ncbi:MAG: hypothetical protein N2506_04230, partial [Dehalococcoidales bacterium]|nr:hypothetical protein [Dehalococcoidales bacterium]